MRREHPSPGRAIAPETTPKRRRRAGGFALIAAIGLLVVLGATGALMLRLAAAERASGSLAILGARGRWAARSGAEWVLHRTSSTGDCPATQTTLDLTEGALSGFRVVVRCRSTSHFEGDEERRSLQIRSEASSGALGSAEYVYREIELSVLR